MKVYAKKMQIKEARLLKGYTQKDLHKKTGLSTGYISDIEQGDTSCSENVAKKIADALDKNVLEIFLLKDTHDDEIAHFDEHTA